MSTLLKPCSTCKHYNGGSGEICCDFCDPPYFKDRWEPIEKGGEDKSEVNEANEQAGASREDDTNLG